MLQHYVRNSWLKSRGACKLQRTSRLFKVPPCTITNSRNALPKGQSVHNKSQTVPENLMPGGGGEGEEEGKGQGEGRREEEGFWKLILASVTVR